MLRRIVFWNVVGDTPQARQENAERIKQLLDSLQGKIPGLLHVEVGINTDNSADACDIAFTADFENQQAIDDYNVHPAHDAIKPQVMTLRSERYVVVYAL